MRMFVGFYVTVDDFFIMSVIESVKQLRDDSDGCFYWQDAPGKVKNDFGLFPRRVKERPL